MSEVFNRESVVLTKADVAAVCVVTIEFRIVGVSKELDLLRRGALPFAKVQVGCSRFCCNIYEICKSEILDLPLTPPLSDIVPLAVTPIRHTSNVKILGAHSGIQIFRSVLVITGHVEGPMVHDVVEIDTNPEPVSRLN